MYKRVHKFEVGSCNAKSLLNQQAFPCILAPFPCRYLEIPLSLTRLRRIDEQALVDAVAARIPTWKVGLLTHARCVLLTKVTLLVIPIHISIASCLSTWALAQIDRRRRAFLWSGAAVTTGGKCKVAWPIIYRPTDLGGLGFLDLRFFGFALRLRWEWLSRTSRGSCWAKLPARSEKAVSAIAAVSMSVSIGDGGSCRVWTDDWAPVGPLYLFAPDLFAAISRTRKKRTLRDGLFQNRWARDIVGAPTVQVLCQYLRV